MNKTLKKILSVVLTLAMIVTSITVYNTTAKAEEEETPNIEVTASVENNMINAKWSQPDVEFATLAYFINEADNIQLDSAHWAKAANGWCWTQANPTEKRTALDTVAKSNDNSIDVSNGGTYVLTVQYLDAEGNVVASGTSNAVTTEKVVNTNLNLKVERYETGIAYLKWSLISGAAKYEVYNADTNELMKTSDSSTTDWTNVTIKQGVTYNLVVKLLMLMVRRLQLQITQQQHIRNRKQQRNRQSLIKRLKNTQKLTLAMQHGQNFQQKQDQLIIDTLSTQIIH